MANDLGTWLSSYYHWLDDRLTAWFTRPPTNADLLFLGLVFVGLLGGGLERAIRSAATRVVFAIGESNRARV